MSKGASIVDFSGATISDVDMAHSKLRICVGPTIYDWIDVEVRHGDVLLRGSDSLSILPEVSNSFYVKVVRR